MITLIIFTGNVPTKKNHLRRIQARGLTLTIASENYCQWEADHVAQLQYAGIGFLVPPYSIKYRIYAPDRRRSDITNKLEGINDALVKAGILKDDNWFSLQKIESEFMGVDRENPRIEVEIQSN